MRFDTVLNNFVGCVKNKIVEVLGDGRPEPICHLSDVCDSVIGYIKAKNQKY